MLMMNGWHYYKYRLRENTKRAKKINNELCTTPEVPRGKRCSKTRLKTAFWEQDMLTSSEQTAENKIFK